MTNKSKQTLKQAGEAFKKKQSMDWSAMSRKELEQELTLRGVVILSDTGEGGGSANQSSGHHESHRSYTPGMIDLAKRCVADFLIAQQQHDDEDEKERETEGKRQSDDTVS